MSEPLMPLATAIWLIDNTTLNFVQIAEFCNMHEMEIQSIADGELATNLEGQNPIILGQLSEENIKKAEKDSSVKLELINLVGNFKNKQKVKYIPIAKRRDKPDAIAWLVKNYPDLPDSKIVKLIGTTKKTIESIRSRSHANISQIQPKDPVLLGICKQSELDNLIQAFVDKS
ncbi:MAG: DUF1013 domain-containing protein [Rickettsiales bacterium]|nr:DUF1013 domain-containing protein [Rickettsiales bacterium]